MSVERITLLRAAVLLIIVVGLVLLGPGLVERVIVDNMGWTDTIPRYVGCQAFWRGQSPYAASVTAEVHTYFPPGTVPSGDEQRFAYPTHLCVLLLPLWALPIDTSAAVWILINFVLLLGLPLAVAYGVLNWQPTIRQSLLLVLGTMLLFRYTGMTLVLGQYTGFVTACLAGALGAFMRQRDGWAGLLLVGMTIRPDGALIAVGVGLLALLSGRGAFLRTFLPALLLIWAITWAVIGPWELDFLDGIRAYSQYNSYTRWIPLELGPLGAVVLCVLLAVWTAGLFWRTRTRSPQTALLYRASAIVIAVQILVPQTNPYTLVYLLPVFYLGLAPLRESGWAWALWLALLALSWVVFLNLGTLYRFESLIFPLAAVVLLSLRGEIHNFSSTFQQPGV